MATWYTNRASSPETADYTRYGIENAAVIDNTGIWRDREGPGKHLAALRVVLDPDGTREAIFRILPASITSKRGEESICRPQAVQQTPSRLSCGRSC